MKNKETTLGNPFRRIKYITPIEEVIRIAVNKYKKIDAPKSRKKLSREQKIAQKEGMYINKFTEEVIKYLNKNLQQFPSIDVIHPFYLELLELIADSAHIKQILGRINGVIKEVRKIKKEQLQKLSTTVHPLEMARIRRETLGKTISLVKKIEKDMKYLIKIIKQLKAIPDFDPYIPTIVVAGAPNVGKSSLIKLLSTAETEVGEYPFTTKRVIFGHRKIKFLNAQIVDTPGLLDKPFEQRNLIEKKTIVTLRHIADIIIFMFDVSKDATLSTSEQINLIENIKESFTNAKILRVLNKIDLLSANEVETAQQILRTEYLISVVDGTGLEELIRDIEKKTIELYKTKEKFAKQIEIKVAEEFKNEEESKKNMYEL